MPAWHDVQRTRGAALLADEAATDRRAGQGLRQSGQSDVDHASIGITDRTLILQVT